MVVFGDPMGVALALKAAEEQLVVEWRVPESEEPIGVKAWVQSHKALRPGNATLQKQLDEWVSAFDAEEERKEKHKNASMAEDGWTVVGRAKASDEGGVSIKSGGVSAAAAIDAKEKALSKQGNTSFYRFHQRDKRRAELLDLKQQFEQDRKKIAELRQSRNFKPY